MDRQQNKLQYYIQYRDKYFKFIDNHTHVKLFRCPHDRNISIIDLKNEEIAIPSLLLTPIPFIREKYLKSREDSNRLYQTKRAAVLMRQIEYTARKNKQSRNSTINNNKNFFYSNSNFNGKSMSNNNKKWNSSNYPLDIVINIQQKWKIHHNYRNEKAEIIQAIFFGFYMRKLLKEIQKDYAQYEKGIKIIKYYYICHFLMLKKISPLKPLLERASYTKLKRKSRFDNIELIQRTFKIYWHRQLLEPHPKMTRHYFIKDGICFLSNINKIQAKAKIYCQYLHNLKKQPKNFTGEKKYRPMMKIIFIQKFLRYHLNQKKIHKRILRDKTTNSSFTREIKRNLSPPKNEENKTSESNEEDIYNNTKFKTKNTYPQRRVNHHIDIKQSFYSKVIEPLGAIKTTQKQVKRHLLRHLHTFPKFHEYAFFTKRILMTSDMNRIVNMQKEVNYFIYRINAKGAIMPKQTVEPMRITKVLISEFKQLYSEAVKVRVDFDRELMNLVVVLHLILRKQYGSYVFNKFFNRLPTSIAPEDTNVYEDPDDQVEAIEAIEAYVPDDDCIDYSAMHGDSDEDVDHFPGGIIIPESQSTLKIHERKNNDDSDIEDDDPLNSFSIKNSIKLFKSIDLKQILDLSDKKKTLSNAQPHRSKAAYNNTDSAMHDNKKKYCPVSIQDFIKNPTQKKDQRCVMRDTSPNLDPI